MKRQLRALAFAVGGLAAMAATAAEAPSACGPVAIPMHYGPYDYVTEHGRLVIVENAHFTPKVEALIAGESGYLGNDLTYTLEASPNHHRALAAVTRLGQRTRSEQPPHLGNTIECYFDRAIRFRPRDTVVRGLYAVYLQQRSRIPEAIQQLDIASSLAEDNGMSHFNIGLVYLEVGAHEAALREAHLAAQLGYDNPVLEDKLKALNRWKEPVQ